MPKNTYLPDAIVLRSSAGDLVPPVSDPNRDIYGEMEQLVKALRYMTGRVRELSPPDPRTAKLIATLHGAAAEIEGEIYIRRGS